MVFFMVYGERLEYNDFPFVGNTHCVSTSLNHLGHLIFLFLLFLSLLLLFSGGLHTHATTTM